MSDRILATRWRSTADGGLEHCALRIADAGITAEGVVIGGAGPSAYGLRYRATFDPDWAAVRSLHLTLIGGATIALRHDGYGEWTDGEGKRRKEFAGALDVDLAATPLCLICSLRRQAWKAGRTQELDSLAIEVPSLRVARVKRPVACVEPGRLWRVADAEVRLDDDGLVALWAGRFERLELPAEVPA